MWTMFSNSFLVVRRRSRRCADRRNRSAGCIEAGAVVLADKERPFGNLLEIVRRVIGGETLIGPGEKERLLELSRLHA